MIQWICPDWDPLRALLVGALLVFGTTVPQVAVAQEPPKAPAALSQEETARFLEEIRQMTGPTAPPTVEILPGGRHVLRLNGRYGYSIGGFRRPDGGFTLTCTDRPAGLEKLLLRPTQVRTDAQGRELE